MANLRLDAFLANFIKTKIADRSGDGKVDKKEEGLFKYSDFGKSLTESFEHEDNQGIDWSAVNTSLKDYSSLLNDQKALDMASAAAGMMVDLDSDGDGTIEEAELTANADNQNLKNIFAIFGSDNADENIFDFAHMQRYAQLINVDGNYEVSATEAANFGTLVENVVVKDIIKEFLANGEAGLTDFQASIIDMIKEGEWARALEEGGDDTVTGGSSDDDTVTGGSSDDDTVTGGSSDDTVTGGSSDDDTVTGGSSDDTVTGGSSDDDTVTGGSSDDTISGGGTTTPPVAPVVIDTEAGTVTFANGLSMNILTGYQAKSDGAGNVVFYRNTDENTVVERTFSGPNQEISQTTIVSNYSSATGEHIQGLQQITTRDLVNGGEPTVSYKFTKDGTTYSFSAANVRFSDTGRSVYLTTIDAANHKTTIDQFNQYGAKVQSEIQVQRNGRAYISDVTIISFATSGANAGLETGRTYKVKVGNDVYNRDEVTVNELSNGVKIVKGNEAYTYNSSGLKTKKEVTTTNFDSISGLSKVVTTPYSNGTAGTASSSYTYNGNAVAYSTSGTGTSKETTLVKTNDNGTTTTWVFTSTGALKSGYPQTGNSTPIDGITGLRTVVVGGTTRYFIGNTEITNMRAGSLQVVPAGATGSAVQGFQYVSADGKVTYTYDKQSRKKQEVTTSYNSISGLVRTQEFNVSTGAVTSTAYTYNGTSATISVDSSTHKVTVRTVSGTTTTDIRFSTTGVREQKIDTTTNYDGNTGLTKVVTTPYNNGTAATATTQYKIGSTVLNGTYAKLTSGFKFTNGNTVTTYNNQSKKTQEVITSYNGIANLTRTQTFNSAGTAVASTTYTYKGQTITVPSNATFAMVGGKLQVTSTSTTSVGASGGSNYVKVISTYNSSGAKESTVMSIKAGDSEFTLNNPPAAFVNMNATSITRVASGGAGDTSFTVVAGGKVYIFNRDTVNTDTTNKKYVYNYNTVYNSVSAYRAAQRTKLDDALAAAGVTLSTATDAILYHTTSQDDASGIINIIKLSDGKEYKVLWSNGNIVRIEENDKDNKANNYYKFNGGKLTESKKPNAYGGTTTITNTYTSGTLSKQVVATTMSGNKTVTATRNYSGATVSSTTVQVKIGGTYYKLTNGALNNLDLDKISSVELLQNKILIKTTNSKIYESSLINRSNNGDGSQAQPIVISGGTYTTVSGSGSYRTAKESALRTLLQSVGITPNANYFTTGFWNASSGLANSDGNDLTLDGFKDSENHIWKIAYNADGSIKSITRNDNGNISHYFTSASGSTVVVSKNGTNATVKVTNGSTTWTLSGLPKDIDETKITRVANYADGRFIVVADGKVYVCKAGSTANAKTYDKTVNSMQEFQKAEINSLLTNSSIQMNASTATFNSNGFITSFKDTAGATWNVTVSGDGQISKIAKDANNYVEFNTATHRATTAKFGDRTYTLNYNSSTGKYETTVTYAGKTNFSIKLNINNPMSLANASFTQDSAGKIYFTYCGNRIIVGVAKSNANAVTYVSQLDAHASDGIIGGTYTKAAGDAEVNGKIQVSANHHVNLFASGQYTVINNTTGQFDKYNSSNAKIGYGYTKNYNSTLKFDFVDYRNTRTAYPKVQSNKLTFAKKADGTGAGTSISIASGDSVTVNADGTVTVKKANGTTKKYSITGSVIS